MIACVDVHYRDPGAVAAGLWFDHWSASTGTAEITLPIAQVAPYQPGQFYLRELPCLVAVLEQGPAAEVVVIDGFVWLGDERRPGLGAHLFRALGGQAAVVGVAKTRFAGAAPVEEIRRGSSDTPLYISAAGMDLSEAALLIVGMHGPHRIPTLLKRVDQLCRRAGPTLVL